jgi:hypothetical protein
MNSQQARRFLEENPSFSFLVDCAAASQWQYVDENLDRVVCEDPQPAIAWAIESLESPNEDLRNLAASIFEMLNGELPEGIPERLDRLVNARIGKYDRFRAACALEKHGHTSPIVTARLNEFLDDPRVALIARKYLGLD